MAERRMFSIKIINSAKFLKMPMETQSLYFHLGLRADDDGVVEAFSVMRLVGATEDSLKLLHAKGFIHVLNDDYVAFITDWHEHNKIRSDRKIDSIYKDLIIQMLPDVKLLESRQRTDRPKNKSSLENCGTSHGKPKDNQGTTNGQSRDGLGEVRLGKDKKNIVQSSDDDKNSLDDFFNTVWSKYPNKTGKTKVSNTQRQKLYKLGDEVDRCISRYLKDKDLKVNGGWKELQGGDRFFNKTYLEYMDNEQQRQEVKKAKGKSWKDDIEVEEVYLNDCGGE